MKPPSTTPRTTDPRPRNAAQSIAIAITIALLIAGCGGTARESSTPPSPSTPSAPSTSKLSTKPGSTQTGQASYYADSLAGHRTASGEPYDPTELTAAHRTLPFGTLVEVTREDGRSVVVRINDRGPFHKKRIIDLSRAAAKQIGLDRAGVAKVTLRVLDR